MARRPTGHDGLPAWYDRWKTSEPEPPPAEPDSIDPDDWMRRMGKDADED